MTYDGRVQNGVIVLDGAAKLPEGAKVRVETVEPDDTAATSSGDGGDLLDVAGMIDGPADWSRNHDHYVHGTAKK